MAERKARGAAAAPLAVGHSIALETGMAFGRPGGMEMR